jgi:hypothetical protein
MKVNASLRSGDFMVMGGGLYIARTTVRIITRTDKYNAFCDTCLGKNIYGDLSISGDFWINLERSTRLELALRAWKALVLPLHHDRPDYVSLYNSILLI